MCGSIQSTVILLPSAIEHALKQNHWLLSVRGHGHIQHIATPSPNAISGKDVFIALKQSVLSNFGDVGWGELGASLAGERDFFPLLLCLSPSLTRGLRLEPQL